ncbi:MAG: DNA-binding response OmpR family regulator [Arenicella sp.]|jgi:DNA-binding response OmpR family regulator
MRILIIEDNPDIAGNIGDYLELHGHILDFAGDGVMGLHLLTENTFDAIILDINMPRMDGFEVCRQLRDEHQLDTPVLMLTARDSLADKTTGFELGAWDYLVKPFELKELAMRLDALTLRQAPNRGRILNVGDLSLNLDKWQAVRKGKVLELHRASLRILEMLMRASPNVVTRQDIEFFLWGDNAPNSDPLRSHMYELRRELDKPFALKMLKTMRGIGFSLSAEESKHGN